jgi:death on curing protein
MEKIHYISYPEAVFLHIKVMRFCNEIRYGVAFPELIESALARPQQAAAYEEADIIRQAATLCFGLIKNHPWVGGNKRTATHIVEAFLYINGWEVVAPIVETIRLVLAIEANQFDLNTIEAWYRTYTNKLR